MLRCTHYDTTNEWPRSAIGGRSEVKETTDSRRVVRRVTLRNYPELDYAIFTRPKLCAWQRPGRWTTYPWSGQESTAGR